VDIAFLGVYFNELIDKEVRAWSIQTTTTTTTTTKQDEDKCGSTKNETKRTTCD
jgi:hypothetical protein